MNRLADGVVLFEHQHRSSLGRQRTRRAQTARTGADDDHVEQSSLALGQNFRSRCSHVPRRLIQNESTINRRSSQNERRLT